MACLRSAASLFLRRNSVYKCAKRGVDHRPDRDVRNEPSRIICNRTCTAREQCTCLSLDGIPYRKTSLYNVTADNRLWTSRFRTIQLHLALAQAAAVCTEWQPSLLLKGRPHLALSSHSNLHALDANAARMCLHPSAQSLAAFALSLRLTSQNAQEPCMMSMPSRGS